eukprot:m.10646 g.10646  ORF g.10646 m.10646 type:complete len:528 (-) comp7116_c0_seq2:1739-3322(-)
MLGPSKLVTMVSGGDGMEANQQSDLIPERDVQHYSPTEIDDDVAATPNRRFEDGRLTLANLEAEPPQWIDEYTATATGIVVVNSALRTLAWVTPFKCITEICADSNRIASLAGCETLPHLQTLSLNMNVITNLNGLLGHCSVNFPRLTLLSLLGNPCCPSEVIGYTATEYSTYVTRVRAILPNLKFLDHMVLDQTQTNRRNNAEQSVLNPLMEAMGNLKSRQFTAAVRDLGKMMINAAIVGKDLGTDVTFSVSSMAADTTREFIQSAKTALANAAPSAAAAALSDADQLLILQKQVLPKLLEHDGAGVIAELTGLYAAGDIDGDEYRRLLRFNGAMQQETAEINRSNTIRALEDFESYVFPEIDAERRALSMSEDQFSKEMRNSGLQHVSFNKVVKRLTHDQLPPELDLSNSSMMDAASVDVPVLEPCPASVSPLDVGEAILCPHRSPHSSPVRVCSRSSVAPGVPGSPAWRKRPSLALLEISPVKDSSESSPRISELVRACSIDESTLPTVNLFTQDNDPLASSYT